MAGVASDRRQILTSDFVSVGMQTHHLHARSFRGHAGSEILVACHARNERVLRRAERLILYPA
jgi:hypothetical protein